MHNLKKCFIFSQVRFLVQTGVDVDGLDEEEKTPLILCCFVVPETWGVGLARIILEKGAQVGAQDIYGLNALHYCCIYERVALAKVCLSAIDCDVDLKDNYGNTALHYAIFNHNVELTKLLLDYHVRYKISINSTNRGGMTPLGEAFKRGHDDCVNILLMDGKLSNGTDSVVKITDENIPSIENYDSPAKPEINMLRPSTGHHLKRPMTREDINTPRKSSSRARSALLSRQTTWSTLPSFRTSTKRSRRPMPPQVADESRIIRCASMTDLRNHSEYVFHLTAVDCFGDNPGPQNMHRDSSQIQAFKGRRPSTCCATENARNWRGEFRKLYTHYEFQCSPSYRRGVTHVLDIPFITKTSLAPYGDAPSDDMSDKSRRHIRRGSNVSKIGLALDKRRPSTARSRRSSITTQGNTRGGMSGLLDPGLGSSNESLNSIQSVKTSKKKEKVHEMGSKVKGKGAQGHGKESDDSNKSKQKGGHIPDNLIIPIVKETLVSDDDLRSEASGSHREGGNRLAAVNEMDE